MPNTNTDKMMVMMAMFFSGVLQVICLQQCILKVRGVAVPAPQLGGSDPREQEWLVAGSHSGQRCPHCGWNTEQAGSCKRTCEAGHRSPHIPRHSCNSRITCGGQHRILCISALWGARQGDHGGVSREVLELGALLCATTVLLVTLQLLRILFEKHHRHSCIQITNRHCLCCAG